MADANKLYVKSADYATTTFATGATSFTVPLASGAAHRCMVIAYNGTGATLRVQIVAGDGIRHDLGNATFDIAASGGIGVYELSDSMRFAVASTNKVTINLIDVDNTALSDAAAEVTRVAFIQG